MTEFENRKHARQPAGYVAVYGQNGITYQQAAYSPRGHKQPKSCLPLVLAFVVIVAIAAAVATYAGYFTF